MGGKSAPEPPDYTQLIAGMTQNAELSAGVAMEQLDWAREEYAMNRELLDDVLGIQIPIALEQWENSQEDRARYEEIFQPIEDDLVEEFKNFDTEERKNREAGRAMSDVARAQDAQREQALQRLEGYGIDPSQTRSAALDANLRAGEAAAMAGAGNQARTNVENTGRALRAEAINIGKGLPSQVAASYGQALQAGQQGIGGANATYGAGADAMGNPTSWMGQSTGAYGQAANTMNMGYGNQMQQYGAEQQASGDFWGGMGSIAGMAMGGGFGTALGAKMFAADGGAIEGPGGPRDDAIPIQASDGEYVIPEDVMRRKGTEFFDKLVEKTQQDVAERAQGGDPKSPTRMQQTPQGPMTALPPPAPQGYAEGGPVVPPGSFQGVPTGVPPQAPPQAPPQQTPAPQPQVQPAGPVPPNATQMREESFARMREKYNQTGMYEKYIGGGETRRAAAQPAASGRGEGESIRDYFNRKYGFGQPSQPAQGIPAMTQRLLEPWEQAQKDRYDEQNIPTWDPRYSAH